MSQKRQARVIGPVQYREGDGCKLPIRPGPVEIEATDSDVTIAWSDGDTRGSAAMPIAEFRRYLDSRAIVIDEARH